MLPENLSPSESRLVSALIAATRKGATPGEFRVTQDGYSFDIDLDGYSSKLTDGKEKQEFEAALKGLCAKHLLKRVDGSARSLQPQWQYQLDGEALEEAQR
jgi:hypothetical protein